MTTTVLWTALLGAKVAVHIHTHGVSDALGGRYLVSRLFPGERIGAYWCVVLWPVGDGYAGEYATVCLDDAGCVVTERAWRGARFAGRLAHLRALWTRDEDAALAWVAKVAA